MIPNFKFKDTWKFRESAIFFEKNGRYNDGGIKDTLDYTNFWKREEKRCIEGLTVDGIRISGYHYFYLNYCPIEQKRAVTNNKDKTVKTAAESFTNFPKFWDLDWMYFTALDIAEYGIEGETLEEKIENYNKLPLELDLILDMDNLSGGKHLLWLKFRGCGASWKGASMPTRNFFFLRKSKSYMYADSTEYLLKDGVFNKFLQYKSFINTHTPFFKYTDVKNDLSEMHVRASHKDNFGNERGYMSEVMAVSVAGKPDKAHPYSSNVLTTLGYKKWGDLQIGDKVFNKEGLPVTVEELHEFGTQDIYTVTLSDGRTAQATLNHEWSIEKWITQGNKRVLKTLICTTKELLDYTKQPSYITNKIKLSIPLAVDYTHAEVPIEAYTLGLLLGDGSLKKSTSNNTYLTMKHDDVNNLRQFIPYRVEHEKWGGDIRNIIYISGARELLKDLNLFDKMSGTKFIPDIYKFNSKKVRLAIINGLLDTDGSVTKDYGVIEYSSKSSQLADDFVWIVRSLGYGAKKGSKVIKGVTYYRCYIYCKPDTTELFNLNRKKDLILRKKWNAFALQRSTYIHVDTIEYSHKENARCITTEESSFSKSGDYLIEDFVPTLNCRGKRGKLVLFEEFGTFNKGGDTYSVTRSSLEELNLVFGTAVLYGTAGIDGKSFETMERMFFAPRVFGFLRFNNVLDDDMIGTECAFFTPADLNVANVDSEGNSDRVTNRIFIEKQRAEILRSSDPLDAAKAKMEHPLKPSEALLRVTNSILPKAELLTHKTQLVASGNLHNLAVYGFLEDTKDGVKFKPTEDARPVLKYPHDLREDNQGCISLWEAPYRTENGTIPDNLYVVCVDPYMHDSSQGDSLGAAYVIKNINNFSRPDDMIVASFVGRPASMDLFHKHIRQLAEYYNAKIGYENNAGQGLLSYFKNNKKLHLLAPEFELGYNENIPKSSVKRGFGMHIDGARKKLGISYLADWLVKQWMTTEDGEILYNYHKINDIGLLDELIKYQDDRNVDRVSALIIAMFHLKEIEYKIGIISDRDKNVDTYFSMPLFQ